jgi:hypothetical protein
VPQCDHASPRTAVVTAGFKAAVVTEVSQFIPFTLERTSKYDGALHSDCDVIATADHHGEEAAKKLPSILLRAKIAAQAHPAHVAGAEGFYNKGIARHSGLASRSLGRATMDI